MTFKNYASHGQRHSSRNIADTKCNGCQCMCVSVRGKRIIIEEYWCDHLHGWVDPHEVTCNYRKDVE